MNKLSIPLRVSLAVVFLTTACLVELPALASEPATPTLDLALTAEAQTLTAVPTATFTASPIPATETATITLTPFPSITPLPTETPTATFTPLGYVEPVTPTSQPPLATLGPPTEEPLDPDEGYTTPYGSEYRCVLASKTPSDWSTLPGKSLWKVNWVLVNAGRKKWDDQVSLVLVSGDRFGAERVSQLRKDVKVGQETTAVITILTPKEPGRYRSVWGLRSQKTGRLFCLFTVKFVIE